MINALSLLTCEFWLIPPHTHTLTQTYTYTSSSPVGIASVQSLLCKFKEASRVKANTYEREELYESRDTCRSTQNKYIKTVRDYERA